MAKSKLILVIFFVWHSVAIVYGSEVKFDGNFWRQSDRTTKELFISGVLGGIQLGQDRVRGLLMQDITNPDFSPKCYDSVSKKIDSLDSGLEKIGTAQVISGIDQFYSDFKNRSIDVKWGFLVVMQQIKGTSKEEIEKFVESVRRNADQ